MGVRGGELRMTFPISVLTWQVYDAIDWVGEDWGVKDDKGN